MPDISFPHGVLKNVPDDAPPEAIFAVALEQGLVTQQEVEAQQGAGTPPAAPAEKQTFMEPTEPTYRQRLFDILPEKLGERMERASGVARNTRGPVQQFMSGATAGLEPAPEPQTPREYIARVTGSLLPFGAGARAGQAVTSGIKALHPAATAPTLAKLGANTAKEAIVFASGATPFAISKALDQTNAKAAAVEGGKELAVAAAGGAALGGIRSIMPGNSPQELAGRVAAVNAAFNAINETSPFDERPMVAKITDAAFGTLMALSGQPIARLRTLRPEVGRSTGEEAPPPTLPSPPRGLVPTGPARTDTTIEVAPSGEAATPAQRAERVRTGLTPDVRQAGERHPGTARPVAPSTEAPAVAPPEATAPAALPESPPKPITPSGAAVRVPVGEVTAEPMRLPEKIDVTPGAPGTERRVDVAKRAELDKMSKAELLREVRIDQPTGLKTRRAFDDDERKQPAPAIASVDVDGLKQVNDTLGHPAGDELLKRVADELKRSGLNVYRTGGDELRVRGRDPARLQRGLDSAGKRLSGVTIQNGPLANRGISFSYGIGKTFEEADQIAMASKAEKKARGVIPMRDGEPSLLKPQTMPPEAKPAVPAPVQGELLGPRNETAQAFADRNRELEARRSGPDVSEQTFEAELERERLRAEERERQVAERELTDIEDSLASTAARDTADDNAFLAALRRAEDAAGESAVEKARKRFAKVNEHLPSAEYARAEAAMLDDLARKAEAEDGGPGTLYSGFPVHLLLKPLNRAIRRLLGRTGVAVQRQPGDPADTVGAVTRRFAQSPSWLAKKYPKLRPYVEDGLRAVARTQRLAHNFRTSLGAIDKVLHEGKYKTNLETYQRIRMFQDMMGGDFTDAEMRANFGATDAVVRAVGMARAHENRILAMLNNQRQAINARIDAGNVRRLAQGLPARPLLTIIAPRAGHVPHHFHEYYVISDGKLVASRPTMAGAVAVGQYIRAANPRAQVTVKQRLFDPQAFGDDRAMLGDREVQRLAAKLAKHLGVPLADAEQLVEAGARKTARTRVFGKLKERIGYEGFESDLTKADEIYAAQAARFLGIAPFKYGSITRFEQEFGEFTGKHEGEAKWVQDYIHDVNGDPRYLEEFLDHSFKNVAPAITDRLGGRPTREVTQAIAKATSALTLGGPQISAPLINLTQLTNIHARLGSKWFAVGNALAFAAEGGRSARRLGVKGAGVRTPGVGRAIMILKQSNADGVMGLDTPAGYAGLREGGAYRLWMAPWRMIERHLRHTAVLGQYEKSRAAGKTHSESIEDAIKINRETNFDNSIADTPAFMRALGPAGTLPFQFKKYVVKQTEAQVMFRGMEQARFWLAMLVLAGVSGAAFNDEAFRAINALRAAINKWSGGSEKREYDTELDYRDALLDWAGDDPGRLDFAKTAIFGVPGLLGADITQRVGVTKLAPDRLSDVWGVAPNKLYDVASSYRAGEDWAQQLKIMAPSIGNPLVVDEQGVVRSRYQRGRPVARLDEREARTKALGFRTTRETLETDLSRQMALKRNNRRAGQQETVDAIIAMIGDEARKPRSERDVEALNRRIAETIQEAQAQGVEITPEMIGTETINKVLGRAARAFIAAPKADKGEALERLQQIEQLER